MFCNLHLPTATYANISVKDSFIYIACTLYNVLIIINAEKHCRKLAKINLTLCRLFTDIFVIFLKLTGLLMDISVHFRFNVNIFIIYLFTL